MDGSAKQIEELYHRDGPGMLRYIRRRGGGSHSEDLLQDTFVRALKQPERIRHARSPRAWLYGVARHVVSDFLRRESRMAELTIDPPAPIQPEKDGRSTVLKAAMAKLPTAQLEALQLRLDAELSYEEIAVALDIPVGTVRSRLHHAVLRLRAAIVGKEIIHE